MKVEKGEEEEKRRGLVSFNLGEPAGLPSFDLECIIADRLLASSI